MCMYWFTRVWVLSLYLGPLVIVCLYWFAFLAFLFIHVWSHREVLYKINYSSEKSPKNTSLTLSLRNITILQLPQFLLLLTCYLVNTCFLIPFFCFQHGFLFLFFLKTGTNIFPHRAIIKLAQVLFWYENSYRHRGCVDHSGS